MILIWRVNIWPRLAMLMAKAPRSTLTPTLFRAAAMPKRSPKSQLPCLEEVGFNVDLTVLDSSAFSVQVSRAGNNRDLMHIALGCGPALLPLFYQCDWSSVNYSICNEEWDAVAEQIQVTIDSDARLDLWEQWWEFYIDTAQTITLYEVTNVMALNTAEFDFTPRQRRLDDLPRR